MNSVIVKTFQTLGTLCLLKGSPADLPFSPFLLRTFFLITLTLQVVTLTRYAALPWLQALASALLYLSLLTGALAFLLARRKFTNRLHKVLIAFLGTELFLTLCMRILLTFFTGEEQFFIPKFFLIWHLLVKSRILKEALEIKMAPAILMTMGLYVVISLPLFFVLFAEDH